MGFTGVTLTSDGRPALLLPFESSGKYCHTSKKVKLKEGSGEQAVTDGDLPVEDGEDGMVVGARLRFGIPCVDGAVGVLYG